jgi:polyhydroxyalkanoate synthesis regulator phasin
MVNRDDLQKYLDAGIAFTNLTRAKAEELVSELVQNGEFQTGDARAKVDELLERSRRSRQVLVSQVRKEVARQLDSVGVSNLEDLAEQVAALIGRSAAAGRAATAKKAPAKKAPAKKSPAKKAPVKKSAAKKAPANAAPTKSAATKSPPKKAAAAKTSGTAGPAGSTGSSHPADHAGGAGTGSAG